MVAEDVRRVRVKVDLSWWEWALVNLVMLLITAPVAVAFVYLIVRKRRP
jgi:heme/copper-type cytochrome/quinol oxidase subunit 2